MQKKAEDDCVEAEIVSGPGAGGHTGCKGTEGGKGPAAGLGTIFSGLFRRIRFILVLFGLLLGFGLIFLGAVLTSTVIGAVLGVPLLILGGACLWLLFKFLTLGQKRGPVAFRRF